MSVAIRCSKCKRFYAFTHKQCTTCGQKDKTRSYYVRLDGKFTYAGNSLDEAHKLDSKMKTSKKMSQFEWYTKTIDITFDEFIKKYYEPHYMGKNKSPESIKAKADYFVALFEGRTLKSISPAEIEQGIVSRTTAQELSPRTHDYYVAVITRIFNYAKELDFIDKSPVKIKKLNVDNERQRYLSDAEEKRLLEACRCVKGSEYLYPMVLIALYTGMRFGEIVGLKKSDVREGMIYLKGSGTKSKRNKVIPVHDAIAYLFEGDSEFNFPLRVSKSFATALKLAEIKDFTFHDLRHTFASKLKKRNVDNSVVQKLLGHSTARMTQRYAHIAPESVLNAVHSL